jgi:hypothetical protein
LSKLTIGGLVAALALAGCGGAGHTSSIATTQQSSAASGPTAPATSTAHTSTAKPRTTSTATHTAARRPATTPGSGGAPARRASTSAYTSPSHAPTPQDVAKAKAALRSCRANDPSITLAQLEDEAASPEGIQC